MKKSWLFSLIFAGLFSLQAEGGQLMVGCAKVDITPNSETPTNYLYLGGYVAYGEIDSSDEYVLDYLTNAYCNPATDILRGNAAQL
jgi:hypothetical protein